MLKKLKKPILIAEIGINHNGSVELAKKIIKSAKDNKFDFVKFQKRDLKICIPNTFKDIKKDTPWGQISYLDYKKKIEFNENQYDDLYNFCKNLNIGMLCSAWDINSLQFINKYRMKYNKIPSALITNSKFLEAVSKQKKKTLISTGMCTIKDIDNAIKIFKKNKCKYVLMHCVSEYPCPTHKLNLNFISTLKKKYKCEVGYSGHEASLSPTLFAWSLGAQYIERHVTIDRSLWGTDQSASLEIAGMQNLSSILSKASSYFGDGIKKITREEKKMLIKFKYW